MKLQGHLAGGWLISRSILKNKGIEKNKRRKLLLLGSFFGILPDLDYLWYAYQKRGFVYKNDFRHHTWISHTFPFYWLISLGVYLLGRRNRNQTTQLTAVLLAASTSVHLAQDMVGSGDGIMLFYPFSKKMKGIALLDLHGDEWEAEYVKSPVFTVEQTFKSLGVITLIYDFLKRRI